MAIITIGTLKGLFQTGDRPTQTDYEKLIDTTASQATSIGSAGNNDSTIYGIESATVIDSFLSTEWRMIKYIISIAKTSAGDNKYFATEMTILVDGTDVNVSEYGTIDTNGNIGTISVSKAGTTVSITVTPVAGITPITVRYARIGLKA
jgi:hypothetical protein